MSIDTTSYYDSLTLASSTDTSVTVTTDTAAASLTSEDFITLLLAELEYQDPTDPVDNSEMVDQMTQYSQLEQMTEMNTKMETLNESMTSMSAMSSLDYIGKQVEADGSTITVSGDDISTLYLLLEEDAASATCNIYNSSGTLVDTLTLSDLESGYTSLSWDGTDYNGETASDGYYYVSVSAEDSNGADVDVTTKTTGTVIGINNTSDGVYLTFEDGRSVNILDVTFATSS
ncbi:flagellar hook assembly protein FlgD [Pseudodesulfovibrio sediminis]|uniref:Basal-body rod modification protein FlgD n=1 Tax=Pseudodesulfovibrio sediminis TaxID=2810563 RepID=A0ABM7P458_9BACT|nr:flagellar hook assembly protein FlgD [Pseudodesulfovibrio sediminis]BCS87649.1 basal-body rod modification protein FlgD [Pseudodesulfovibrio sediminis]